MHVDSTLFRNSLNALVAVSILAGLYLTSLYSYLLFHSLTELFSIAISGAIFVLAWNFQRFYKGSFLNFIGTAYLFCSIIDLLHTLTFKGMTIFAGADTNLPTQLWIAARYLQSGSLLVAPFFLHRKVKMEWLLAGFTLVTTLLLLSIFVWNNFPVAYIEGTGLTSFKITSEYIIDILFLSAIAFLWVNRRSVDRIVLQWIILSISLTIISELAFTFYIDVYSLSNLVGHFGKIIAYYLLYKAVIETEAGAIYADMTKLRETESALRVSEHNLKLFIEHAPTGIAMLDRDMRYIAASRRYITDYHLLFENITGMLHYEVFPEIPERWKEMYRRCLAGATEKSDEDEFVHSDGSVDWVRWEVLPWEDIQGEPAGIILFSEVISERKRMTQELAQANSALLEYAEKLKHSNQELEQFAFIASHDLQEPLRKIRMFSERLQNQLSEVASGSTPANGSVDNTMDSLRRMQNAAERMQAMIDGLLELSRVNTHTAGFQQTSLNSVIEDVIIDLEARIRSTGGQVIVNELHSAEIDALQIRRLFLNLIGNALKFHKPDQPPFIEVSSTMEHSAGNTSLTIRVNDNGIGFDEMNAQLIFQPFQRLHGRAEYEGTGLGLSICYKIVERHHGKIEAHSQPGQGSIFQVTLPVHQPRPTAN